MSAVNRLRTALVDEGINSLDELQDVLYDYELCQKELQEYRRKYDIPARVFPSGKEGVYLCPECGKRTSPWNASCHRCGKRL